MTQWKKKYEDNLEKLALAKEEVAHWRERALISERQIKSSTERYGILTQSYYLLQAELEETKKRLPTGAILTHIDNLIRINEAMKKELLGEPVNFWQRFRTLGRLLFVKS